MRYDLHTHTEYSDGHLTVRSQVRSAEAIGLDYLAVTDHYYEGMGPTDPDRLRQYLHDIEHEGGESPVRVLKGLEVTVVNVDGDLSAPPEVTARLDFVLAELSRTTEGAFRNPPGSKRELIDNVSRCMVEGCRHECVDAFAHPFNVGWFPIPLRPLDFSEARLREIAQAFRDSNTAFNIITPMVLWFPQMSVPDITREYTEVVSIFAAEGVRFVMGSDDHWTGVGNLAWAEMVLEAACVPSSQHVNPRSYLDGTGAA